MKCVTPFSSSPSLTISDLGTADTFTTSPCNQKCRGIRYGFRFRCYICPTRCFLRHTSCLSSVLKSVLQLHLCIPTLSPVSVGRPLSHSSHLMRLVRPFQIEEESAAGGGGKGPLLRNLDGGGRFPRRRRRRICGDGMVSENHGSLEEGGSSYSCLLVGGSFSSLLSC